MAAFFLMVEMQHAYHTAIDAILKSAAWNVEISITGKTTTVLRDAQMMTMSNHHMIGSGTTGRSDDTAVERKALTIR